MIRLHRAVCGVLEAHAEATRQPPPEPPREVDLTPSQVEHAGQYQRDELNADAVHRDEDWSEDPDQDRTPRIGFTSTPSPATQTRESLESLHTDIKEDRRP